MSKIKVQFLTGTSQQYNEISPSINQYTFYFTTDDQRVYLGTKELTTDVQSGTTEYWNSNTDLTSIKNRIYVYTDYYIDNDGNYVPGLKIGDGNAYVVDLPFIDERFLEHIQLVICLIIFQQVLFLLQQLLDGQQIMHLYQLTVK